MQFAQKFRFRALIKTAAGAQGYLDVPGTITQSPFHKAQIYAVILDNTTYFASSVEDLIEKLEYSKQIEFLDSTVADRCIIFESKL